MLWLNILKSVDHRLDSRLARAHRKTATSVSEATTGRVTSACVPCTAVSLLANLAERLGNQCRNETVSSEAALILPPFSLSPALFGPRFLDAAVQKSLLLAADSVVSIHFSWECTRNLCLQVLILLFSKAPLRWQRKEKAKVKVYLHRAFPSFLFLKNVVRIILPTQCKS